MSPVVHKRNFIGLKKEGDFYLFFYDDEDAEEMVRVMARFAANPDLSFNWHDAAVLSRDVAVTVGLDPPGSPDTPWNVESRI